MVSEIHNGKLLLQEYKPEYFFYIEDSKGKYISTTDKKLSRIECRTYKQFQTELRRYRNKGMRTYEGSVRPLFKTLEKYYQKQKTEKINVTFYDIEVEWSKERGFASPDDPFNRITAISLYNSWESALYSLTLQPNHMTIEEGEKLLEGIENNIICESEEQLITLFFELTKDTNVYSGWNSALFDSPYMINRIQKIMGNETVKKFCLWNQMPQQRIIKKYGKEQQVYDLIGKVHLDMLELYQKYTYIQQPSYRLDYIGELEIGENKVPYEGTLDTLYNNDYRKFIEYARQDTMMLYKLDKKLDHINLVFKIAHENLVDVKTVMGAVALSDNAIVLEAHRRNMIMPDRKDREGNDESKIAGAWVADPHVGLQEWVSAVDLTSLYPSIFRTLNLGNETIVAQIEHTLTGPLIKKRLGEITDVEIDGEDGDDIDEKKKNASFAKAWHDIFWVLEVEEVFNKTDTILNLQIEDGETIQLTAKEIYEFVFENDFIITANGTIIRTDKQSVISSLLEKWFNERVIFQKKAKAYKRLATEGIDLPADILSQLK